MAPSTPITIIMLVSIVTNMLVNIMEMALVSLATRVTSLPVGMLFSCSWDRLSIWVNTYLLDHPQRPCLSRLHAVKNNKNTFRKDDDP